MRRNMDYCVVALMILFATCEGCNIVCRHAWTTFAVGCHFSGVDNTCHFTNCNGLKAIELIEIITRDRVLNFSTCVTLRKITFPLYQNEFNNVCQHFIVKQRLQLLFPNSSSTTCEVSWFCHSLISVSPEPSLFLIESVHVVRLSNCWRSR